MKSLIITMIIITMVTAVSLQINDAYAGTTPSAHTSLTFIEGKNSIVLSFTGSNHASFNTSGGAINEQTNSGTIIQRCQGESCTDFTTIGTSNGTGTFTDSTILKKTPYNYRVLAANSTAQAGALTATNSVSAYGGTAVSLCTLDCTPPTLGVDANGNRIITDGFTYNGKPQNVQLYFTPMDLVTVNVGKENVAILKIFEESGPENIAHAELAFGLAYGNLAIQQSTASIYWDKSGILEKTTVFDPENTLENVRVESSIDGDLLTLKFYHTFRAPLDFNMLGTYVWDVSRNGWQNYYNHGVEVIGDSLNPPNQYEGIYKGKIHHLVEVEKNKAIDEYGDMWTYSYSQWVRDYVKPVTTEDGAVNVMTRNHSAFNYLKQEQINKAQEQMKIICPSCSLNYNDFDSSFTHDLSGKTNKLNDKKVIDVMESEAIKAQKFLDERFAYLYDNLHGKEVAKN